MQAPDPFDLDLTVRSHGFYDLAPWSYDTERCILSRPLRLSTGRVVTAEIAPAETRGSLALRLSATGRVSAGEAADARGQIRTCLALDEDLGPFYRLVRELETGEDPVPPSAGPRTPSAAPQARSPAARSRRLPALAWAAERGAGRLLRSPTVFEDTIKTLCTTNCSWALTRTMTANLVARLGEPGPRDDRAFPTPQAMAGQSEQFYRDAIRAGYRAGALRSIARDVASGALDVERWRDPAIPTDQLATEILELPGFGPYATEHLLKLLGHYDHLALDSWTRAKLARLRGYRRVPADRTIRRWYAPYGRFAGLAMWLEVTADWHGPQPTWP